LGDACKHIQFEIQPSGDGFWELEIEDFDTAWKPSQGAISIESAEKRVRAEFVEWLSGFPKLALRYEEARQLAAYILWSAIVSLRGHFRREAMLMSKNWMTNVWSWDHCFNAIALVASQPDLAWDQWAVMFDLQNPFGALPDCANDADMVWNFCKPPVHGWALREMRARGFHLTAQKKKQACAWLEKWTDWWMTYRDEDADGLPQYNHGNDSGWDNASCFALGMPIEGPDLAAFLVIQMDVIADLCDETGQAKNAKIWRRRADELLDCINSQLWTGSAYLAPRSGDHAVSDGDSLVNFMPIVLGSRLSKDQRAVLVRGLNRFVTAHGLATENPKSKYYTADGYWRGPVWAPSTFLIVEGLKACGEQDLARKIAKRFCATCSQSGMAENFDALTGEGLRDRAYTWTSGIFMLMASESTPHPA
jgi:glycogen debranching enzyme